MSGAAGLADVLDLDEAWERLSALVDPVGGLLQQVVPFPAAPGSTPVTVCGARLGDLGEVLPNVRAARAYRRTRNETDGAAGDVDVLRARVVSAAEAVERYASCVFRPEQLRWARPADLGSSALFLDAVPRCSDIERSHPNCVLRLPDEKETIRWVEGVSLHTGRSTWLPAVMVYLHIPYASPAERFWLPISTGCAGHFDRHQALLNAVLEVVERDAISVVWHQMLELPRLDCSSAGPEAQRAFDTLRRGCVEITFLDATFEHGIPTIYGLERSPRDPDVHQIVVCAVDLHPSKAIAKIVREAASSRIALGSEIGRGPQRPVDEFIGVSDGALYLAPESRASAFDFLLHGGQVRRSDELPILETGNSETDLRLVLDRLAQAGHEVFAVDLTTDECRRIGFSVFRALIPSMQPLSFAYRAQFRGHPRLYDVPRLLDLPVRAETDLNPWPQAFA